jgi:hypothetical protein
MASDNSMARYDINQLYDQRANQFDKTAMDSAYQQVGLDRSAGDAAYDAALEQRKTNNMIRDSLFQAGGQVGGSLAARGSSSRG